MSAFQYNVPRYRSVPISERREQVIAVDVTGRRHTVLADDADALYEALSSGNWDHSVWLDTVTGVVRYGALAFVMKP